MDDEKEIQIEARLIEQEHRLIPVILNVIETRRKYEKSDSRRIAAVKALVWRLFTPANAAVVGMGAVSFLGVWVAYQSNTLIKEQNKLIQTQNVIVEATRRSSMVFELTAIFDQINQNIEKFDKVTRQTSGLDCSPRDYVSVDYYIPPTVNNTYYVLPPTLSGRAIALSLSFKPYAYLDVEKVHRLAGDNNNSDLTGRNLSPERAQMLLSLVKSNIDIEPINSAGANFSSSDFVDFNLNGLSFNGANISSANFTGAEMVLSDFTNTNLYGALLVDANGICTKFDGADMRNTDFSEFWYEGATFKGTNLRGAYTGWGNTKEPITADYFEDWQIDENTQFGSL
ncbi:MULTISPECIES: pentapeptide repeat-containing protein [unclassified Pseudoalteromonas]|uniref:pentapeptide repeat-containing protein n=1 Tax=unclassified Pseudoalteromonas TaxID=194690 RepID=UPI001F3F60A2|nr:MULTISPECIES: pentapeptide repeat-containing protein [unclassified Pseudoalteromonas]MCF2829401.1 pentapeptide repeat-containing protein [Pseudoalteromonas sp. OF5H-5]MCF2831369.1 pentapeptide repeat-containing protein [Pseudoalteromonas sp. DL2-H6]MCF2927068.1 pentapeptide repeat-containing protein [Pseudoalteromonas sp. DL2-H1]